MFSAYCPVSNACNVFSGPVELPYVLSLVWVEHTSAECKVDHIVSFVLLKAE